MQHSVGERPSAHPPLIDGRYRVLDELGSGGAGVVVRAHDIVLERTVALKLLRPGPEDAAAAARFRKEAHALAQVRHESVVKIYSLGEDRGAPYFAMQFVEGTDLGTIIREHAANGATVPRERALRILREVASGLGAVHLRGIVHRDVKPTNIVIEKRSARPVLVDFALARKRTASNPNLSSIGGTPAYMAPEQATDATGSRVSSRSDLYSLACTAFELFTNRSVFEGEDGFGWAIAHAKRPAPPISSVMKELAPFDEAFARALAKTPEDRQESCEAFVAELERASAHPRHVETGVRVLLLASSAADLTPIVARALRAFGRGVEIACFARDVALAQAFVSSPADIVIIDHDTSARSDTLAEGLRHAANGRDVEILLVGGDHSSRRLEELGARELPKPLDAHVFGIAVARMGTRIAERRADRRSSK